MNRLQLATLLSWAGDAGLAGRKRLQKVVYFLQEAGCPLRCDYVLLHFGPYSRDVADRSDEMVAARLLIETPEVSPGSTLYRYSLSPEVWQSIARERDAVVETFRPLGTELINLPLWRLELGSTILFYLRSSNGWQEAFANACKFKKASVDHKESKFALQLAQRIHAMTQH